jgi:hypothetical protein
VIADEGREGICTNPGSLRCNKCTGLLRRGKRTKPAFVQSNKRTNPELCIAEKVQNLDFVAMKLVLGAHVTA